MKPGHPAAPGRAQPAGIMVSGSRGTPGNVAPTADLKVCSGHLTRLDWAAVVLLGVLTLGAAFVGASRLPLDAHQVSLAGPAESVIAQRHPAHLQDIQPQARAETPLDVWTVALFATP